jgi:hypothetical protein
MKDGLRPGTYASPNGNLSGLQAQIELATPPNRVAPDIRIRIDMDALSRDGFEIPLTSRVSNIVTDPKTGRVYSMPGGGYEMNFPYKITSKYLGVEVIQP